MARTTHRTDIGKQLAALSELSRAITSDKYLKDILGLGVTLLAEVLNTKLCSLMLLDEQKQELSIRATQSISEEYLRKPPLKVGEGIVGRVAKEKRPIAVRDVTAEKDYRYRDLAVTEGLASMLSVPLLAKNKVI